MFRLHPYRLVVCLILVTLFAQPLIAKAKIVQAIPNRVPATLERSTLSFLREWLIGSLGKEICRDDEGVPCRLRTLSLPAAIDAGCLIDPHGVTCPN